MNISYKGIGETCATFEVASGVTLTEGMPVKLSANGTVTACASADKFIGVVESVREGFASVIVGGFVTAAMSGTAPALGYVALVADGAGGVTAGSGNSYLIVSVDTDTVTILL